MQKVQISSIDFGNGVVGVPKCVIWLVLKRKPDGFRVEGPQCSWIQFTVDSPLSVERELNFFAKSLWSEVIRGNSKEMDSLALEVKKWWLTHFDYRAQTQQDRDRADALEIGKRLGTRHKVRSVRP